ncbi:MAG: hypothetical protein Kow0029_25670 [Candidatus Rifleibacteriota bacterium]
MARKTTQERKDQIIEVTRDLIFNQGFSNFTVRTVAVRVGISEAAIYKHYSSKEELLMALLDYLFLPWQKALKSIAEKNIPACDRLRELATTHIDFLVKKKLNPQLFFSEAADPANSRLLGVLQKNLVFWGELVFKLFSEAVKNKEIRQSVQIDCASSCFIGIVQSSVIRWTVFKHTERLKEVTLENVNFFLECLKINEESKNESNNR